MNLDFGRISVNVYFMLCCPTKLLALIKNLSLKISRDLCVPTWYIGLAGFRKDCLCCQWHRKQHVNIAGGWLLLCVALWFVVFFFESRKIVTLDFQVSAQATWTCYHRCTVDLALDLIKPNWWFVFQYSPPCPAPFYLMENFLISLSLFLF